jgi:rhodanese-related sulfurtransferase
MVYDGDGGNAALQVARVIKESGQPNVTVISGGLDAWKNAKNSVATGALPTKVAYVPKPRPGSIANDEFVKLATATPVGVLILDVRNTDEANAGMIKGAMLIPDEELQARMGEVPKDKRIITHCSTGIRAEMAYHKLKDAGYNVTFLYAALDVKKNGEFKVTPN